MSEVKNCHYVSRVVTRPWESASRHLHYFDIATNSLDNKPSKKLFAVEGLHSTKTERALSLLVEDPIGKYRQLCEKAGAVLVDPEDERMRIALLALIVLQVQRTSEALAPERVTRTLDELLENPAELMTAIAAFERDYRLVGGSIQRDEWMVYPSIGWFLLPVADHPPALALPLSPRTFVTLFPRKAVFGQFEDMVRTRQLVATFSMLGGGLEHKLIIPACIAENTEPTALISYVNFVREQGRKMFNLIGKTYAAAGLKAFGYD